MDLKQIRKKIENDPLNAKFKKKGYRPVYSVSKKAKVVIVGQTPGRIAQQSGISWNDLSGDNLREWLGISRDVFYDNKKMALVPMDFYFPGNGKTGDLPPRKGFAEKWHPLIFENMPNVKLVILIGKYSQDYYLGLSQKKSLTETVKSFKDYLPKYFPLVHPSPRNNIWQKKNPWFKKNVLPELRSLLKTTLV